MTTVVLQHPVEQINSLLVQAAVGFEGDGNDGDAHVGGDVLVSVVLGVNGLVRGLPRVGLVLCQVGFGGGVGANDVRKSRGPGRIELKVQVRAPLASFDEFTRLWGGKDAAQSRQFFEKLEDVFVLAEAAEQ